MESPILFIENLAEFERHSLEALSAHIENDNGFSLGAFDGDGHLVGMVDFRRESSLRLDHIGFIGKLYVAPSARGEDLGRTLIYQTLGEARKLGGIKQVKLQLEAGNSRARVLYESFGFEAWGLEPDAVRVDGVYYDDLHMILKDL